MRIAVLWSGLSGYLNASLRELASRPGVDLLVVHTAATASAPFDSSMFAWMPSRIQFGPDSAREDLLRQLHRFQPDVILVSGWQHKAYRFVLQRLAPRPVRVLCMDNQWRGTLRQLGGVIVAPIYVRNLYDAVFLPGERQAEFARRLGFGDKDIWHGLLVPDSSALSGGEALPSTPRHRFGYLGRLSPEKGLADLLRAHSIYRETNTKAWTLEVAGTGALGPTLQRYEGVVGSGFIQPPELRAWMLGIGCLIVPSRFEPWGVALSEGCAAGLPIIATDACGAVPHLVHDYVNGRVARTGDPASLASCMGYIAQQSDGARESMGKVSSCLAAPYTPTRWADTVLGRSAQLLDERARTG